MKKLLKWLLRILGTIIVLFSPKLTGKVTFQSLIFQV